MRERERERDVRYSIRAEEREKQGSSEKHFHFVGKYHYFIVSSRLPPDRPSHTNSMTKSNEDARMATLVEENKRTETLISG